MMDAFSNPIARLGYGTQDLLQATQYPLTRTTQNYQMLTSLYRENWIVQNIIETIPGDMVRKWYTLKCNVAPEYVDACSVWNGRCTLESRYWKGCTGGVCTEGPLVSSWYGGRMT